jgi:hypothetical protein
MNGLWMIPFIVLGGGLVVSVQKTQHYVLGSISRPFDVYALYEAEFSRRKLKAPLVAQTNQLVANAAHGALARGRPDQVGVFLAAEAR